MTMIHVSKVNKTYMLGSPETLKSEQLIRSTMKLVVNVPQPLKAKETLRVVRLERFDT